MNILEHKYQYFRSWYIGMTMTERSTQIGEWVFERVAMFSELLRQQEQETKQFKRNVVL